MFYIETLTQGGLGFISFDLFRKKEPNKTNIKVKCNDPSAGSPTDTLLRLLLPLIAVI